VRGNRRNHEPNRNTCRHRGDRIARNLPGARARLDLDFGTRAGQPTGVKQTEVFKTTMNDVLGRVLSVRVLERDPGTGSGAHRHPGSHTVATCSMAATK